MCDPALKPSSDNPWSYRMRGERCEGVYLRDVGAQPLRVVSFTGPLQGIDPAAGQPLRLQWVPARWQGPVRLRAESLRHRSYYRMDALRDARDGGWRWPSEVLAAQGLALAELGLLASTQGTHDGSTQTVLLPLQVSQGVHSIPAAGAYQVTLLPGLELDEVFVTVMRADSTTLRGPATLGQGYYPAQRPISVPLPALPEPGLYRLRLGATLKDGGSSTLELWFYHPG